MIRSAAKRQAEYDAQVKALRAEISEFKATTIKGHLGFKLSDWATVYSVSQLTVTDRDTLLDCIREGFSALGVGQAVDWVDMVERTPRGRNGTAPADDAARAWGRSDGLGGVHDHAGDYPPGEPGHGDYMLGLADGEAERDRVMALGNGGGAPKRRGRPRKQQQEAEADAEF
jgi:hypothetical protein